MFNVDDLASPSLRAISEEPSGCPSDASSSRTAAARVTAGDGPFASSGERSPSRGSGPSGSGGLTGFCLVPGGTGAPSSARCSVEINGVHHILRSPTIDQRARILGEKLGDQSVLRVI